MGGGKGGAVHVCMCMYVCVYVCVLPSFNEHLHLNDRGFLLMIIVIKINNGSPNAPLLSTQHPRSSQPLIANKQKTSTVVSANSVESLINTRIEA